MTTTEFILDDSELRQVTPEPRPDKKPPKEHHRSIWKTILVVFLSFVGLIVFCALALYTLFIIIPQGPEIALSRSLGKDTTLNHEKIAVDEAKVLKSITALEKKIDKLSSEGPYLIVNTTENRFYLYDKNVLIREGRCSTGKNTKLIDEKRNQEFKFKTPRGVRKVISKQEHPVWAKPNWAFIEEGLPIPPAGHESRFDAYTLGDYKLVIGDGYMVHGTLWKRRMGLNVTHGCVRLLDDDLKAVYTTLGIGSKVIIY